jgi:uncharacterized protein YjlB
MQRVSRSCVIRQYFVSDNRAFPGSQLPVLHYKKVLNMPFFLPGLFIRRLFARNNWRNFWRSGVLDYNHYHSVTHEVLAIIRGKAKILLGGNHGKTITVEKGDVLIIPAGVAHRNLNGDKTLVCIGAYPNGKEYDMKYGRVGERPAADKNIEKVPLPPRDPVFGVRGGIKNYWGS